MRILLAGVSPARAYAATSATNVAKKNNPVAVVYYRCELKTGPGGKEYCTPHNCLYYVHNGVALEDLPIKPEERVLISHVATKLEDTNKVYIFGEKEAAQAVKDGKGKICCGSEEGADKTWRPWIWVRIHPYAVNHQPIAWVVDKKAPHNGVFKCFQKEQPGSTCDDKIPAENVKGTLEYWHYENHDHEQQGLVEARTAFDPGKFSEHPTKEQGDNFKVVKQPPPPTDLKPCP